MTQMRAAETAEAAAVNAFCDRCYGQRISHRLPEGLPPGGRFPFNQLLLDDAGGRVGHGFFHPKEVWIRNRRTTVGDVGNICTDPEQRGRGYGAVLIRGLVEVMRTARLPLSVLGGLPDFYRKFGWEATGGTVELDAAGTVDVAAPLLPPVSAADMAWIPPLYDRVWERRTGMRLRSPRVWQEWLPRIHGGQSVVLPGHDGYACFELAPDGRGLLDEITAVEEAAFIALLDAVWRHCRQAAIHTLEFHAHRDGPEHRRFVAWCRGRELTLAREIFFSGSMWRIVDLAGLLQDLGPELAENMDEPLSLEIVTGESRAAFDLGPAGFCLVDRAENRLDIPVGRLAQWLLGPARLTNLIAQGQATLTGAIAPARLDRLFPATAIYTALTDRD